jgi:hypothetical protein
MKKNAKNKKALLKKKTLLLSHPQPQNTSALQAWQLTH